MRNLVRRGGSAAHFDRPNGRGFVALLEAFQATGGAAPDETVGRLLQEHPVCNAVSLARLIHTGQAFGFEWRDSLWMPMFQFEANDLVLETAVQGVRAELPSLWSGCNVATWFAAPDAQLDSRSPVEALETDLEAVVRAAQSIQALDAFAAPLARRAHQVALHV